MEEEEIEGYRSSLADLTANSKPLINMLTMLAEDHEQFAPQIVQVIETQLQQVESPRKLPILYLIDSIIKNLPKSTYPTLFSHNLQQTFCGVFEKVDEKTRQCMYKVRQTWSEIFSNRMLYAIDVKVAKFDPAWPITAKPPTEGSIHVNPKFLYKKDDEESIPSSPPELPALPALPVAPELDEEKIMRQQLIDKQAELLRLQQQRLELELQETKAKLEQQQQINKEQESILTNRSISAVTPSTGGMAPTNLDPRTGSRDPRTASRDPRLATRDPRLSTKSVPSSAPETKSSLGARHPHTASITTHSIPSSDPLSVLLPPPFPGISNAPPMVPPHLIPPPPVMSHSSQPFIPRGMMPQQPPNMPAHHAGGMVHFPPGQMPQVPVMSRNININNQALPTNVNSNQQLAGPSSEVKNESTLELSKKGSKGKEPESHSRNRRDLRDSKTVKDKRDHDRRVGESSRKDNRDVKERNKDYRDVRESRQSRKSSSPHHDRGGSNSGRESKGKDMREDEESRHKKKRDAIEESTRGNRSDYLDDKKREPGRSRTTRSHKSSRETKDSDRKETKSKRDSKEKSPSRKARSRSPIHKGKEIAGGSKLNSKPVHQSPRKKPEEKAHVDTNKTKEQKEALMEKEEANEKKLMLEAGYRIPKKEPVQDMDDRQTMDRDERQLKAQAKKETASTTMTRGNSKRDLSEVEEDKSESVDEDGQSRTNKKPRLEMNSPVNGENTGKLTEDISDLFGCEDQDYRSKADIDQRSQLHQTPNQKGWAQYKADHPIDFAYELEQKEKQDIDHRNRVDTDHRSPLDMDHRKTADRNMMVRQGVGQQPPNRAGVEMGQDRDADFRWNQETNPVEIPSVFSIDNRIQILEQIEKRRKSGDLSHTDEQELLKELNRLDIIQKLQQKRDQMKNREMDAMSPPREAGPVNKPWHQAPEIDSLLVQRDELPRDGPLQKRDGPLQQRDSPRKQRDGPLKQIDGPPHQRDGPLHQQDVPLQQRDGPLHQRDDPLQQRDGPLHQRDGPLHQRDGPPQQRDGPLHQRDGPPQQRDGPLHHRDDPLQQRDGQPRLGGSERERPPRDGPSYSRDGLPRERQQRDGPREGAFFDKWTDPRALGRDRYGPKEREYRSPRSDFDDNSRDIFPYPNRDVDRREPPHDLPTHMDRREHSKDENIRQGLDHDMERRGLYEPDRPGPSHARGGHHDERFPDKMDHHRHLHDVDRRDAPFIDKRRPFDRSGPRDHDRRGPPHEMNYRNDVDGRGPHPDMRPPHNMDKFHDRRGPPDDRNRHGHPFRDNRQGPHDDEERMHDDQDRPEPYHPREQGMHGSRGRGRRLDWDRRDRYRPDDNRHSSFDDKNHQRPNRQQDGFNEMHRNSPPPQNPNRTPNRFRNQYRIQISDPRWANLSGMMGSENSEEFVIDGKPYSVQLGAPPRKVRFGKVFLTLYADPNERCLKVDNMVAYRFGDFVREMSLTPDNRTYKVFYHGAPRLLWIDGVLHELRLDAPPKIIFVKEKEHTIRLDGRDGMIILDKTELGHFGGQPRFVFIDETRCELRFDPPPRQILIDGNLCELKLDWKIPCVMIDNVPHGIRFDGPPRDILVNGTPYNVPMDRPVKIRLNNRPHFIAFGGPAHEVIFDGRWFEVKFGGPPKQITVGNRMVDFRLEGNSPDVKILEPLKDPDLMIAVNNTQFGPNAPMPRPPLGQQPGPPRGPMIPPVGPGDIRPERPMMQMRNPGMMERPMGPQNMGPVPQMPGPQGQLIVPQGPMMGPQGPVMGMTGPMLGPQGPMMGPVTSVMGPVPPQVAPGQMGVAGLMPGQPPPTSVMMPMGAPPPVVSAPVSSSAIPGLGAPPLATMPGIPSALSSILAPAQAAQPSSQIDVGSLFQKLLASGIIAKPETKEEKPEEKKIFKIPKSKKLDDIPDLLDLKADKLKKPHSGVMQRMYCGIQCTSCGLRFTAQQTDRYREHLDWHFRQNQREKEGSRISKNRKWFYEIDEWIQYEEIDESEERGRSDVFEQTSSKTNPVQPVLHIPEGPEIEHCPTATGDENGDVCEICGDSFEQFFDEEQEEWLLKDAVRSEGKTYHPVCYEDAREGSIAEPTPTPTPSKGPEDNPLIMQIKKELGQLPADTVIHYKEDMIVKPKIKTELPDVESVPLQTSDRELVIKQEVTSDNVIVKQEPVDTPSQS